MSQLWHREVKQPMQGPRVSESGGAESEHRALHVMASSLTAIKEKVDYNVWRVKLDS